LATKLIGRGKEEENKAKSGEQKKLKWGKEKVKIMKVPTIIGK